MEPATFPPGFVPFIIIIIILLGSHTHRNQLHSDYPNLFYLSMRLSQRHPLFFISFSQLLRQREEAKKPTYTIGFQECCQRSFTEKTSPSANIFFLLSSFLLFFLFEKMRALSNITLILFLKKGISFKTCQPAKPQLPWGFHSLQSRPKWPFLGTKRKSKRPTI